MLIHMAKLAPSGRMYYRHPSGMGSVMMYYDDREFKYLRRTLVLDSKYRSNHIFGCYGIKSGNREVHCNNNGLYITKILSDKKLINSFPRDTKSSRENCDKWMKLNLVKDRLANRVGYVGVPAVSYCRNICVDDIPCDLPNINILMRIFIDRETIDDLDPTIEEHPDYALSKKYNPQGDWRIGKEIYHLDAWIMNDISLSSTARSIKECLAISNTGWIFGEIKSAGSIVIPVLELK